MIILPSDAKAARKKERTIRPIKPPRGIRKNYETELLRQVSYLKAQTVKLSEVLASGADKTTVARTIAQMARESQARIDEIAPQLSNKFVGATGAANKLALEQSIAKAFSVDFASVIDGADVAGELQLAIDRNVGLIKTITDGHFADVGKAVLDNYRGVPQVGGVSLQKRLQDIGGISANRAKFIARDQTAKLTSDLNRIRQEENSIDEYIWRNAGDQRVVGNPSGLYPKGTRAHGNHWDREGKVYSWKNPPGDGNPGMAYNCRCYAEPKLDLEKLKAKYV